MIETLCLSFLHAAGSSLSLPPPNMQELLKRRIVHQWSQRHPNSTATLSFDDPSCSMQGNYHYTDRSILLSADSEVWRGPLELPLAGVIEGEQLPFERVSQGLVEARRVSQSISKARGPDDSRQWKKWMPWTLALAGVAVGAYMIVDRERHIRQLQGLSLSF